MVKRRNRLVLLAAIGVAETVSARLCLATIPTSYFNGGGGNSSWSNGSNWNGGEPGSGYIVNIISPGSTVYNVTYDYSGSAVTLNTLAVDQTGGLVNTLTMSANNLTSGPEYVGYDGGGAFVQSGGTNTMNTAGFLLLGNGATSTGTYTLSGSGSIVDNGIGEYIGGVGAGFFTQSGGSNTIGTGGFLYVGSANKTLGIYTLSGGSANSGGGLYVGGNNYNNTVGTGMFTLSSTGSLTSSSGEYIGYSGTGIFLQSGGVNTLGSGAPLNLGNVLNATGTYTLSGGTLSAGGSVYVGGWSNGPEGVGILNVNGSGTLTVAGTLTAYNTPGSAIKISGGSTSAAALNLAGMYSQSGGSAAFSQISGGGIASITGGKTTLTSNGGLSQVGGLTVSGTGTLDLTNNSLAINYSSPSNDPVNAIVAALRSGYSGGTWKGDGITSSLAAGNDNYSLGYADGNTDVGTPAGANQLLIAYTLAGDAFLEGSVSFADLLVVAQNYDKTGFDWSQGNFTYDPSGSVGFADLLIVAQNYGQTVADQSSGMTTSVLPLSAAVSLPEPAGAAVLAGLAAVIIGRRSPKYRILP